MARRALLALALLLAAASLLAAWIARGRAQGYADEAARLTGDMTDAERALQAHILATQAEREDLVVDLLELQIARAAAQEDGRHLRLSLEERTLALVEDGRVLRELPVALGPEGPIVGADGSRWFFPLPVGQLSVGWAGTEEPRPVPEWWYVASGEPDPGEGQRPVAALYGAASIILSDGTVIYASPTEGPWAAEDAVRHGGIECAPADLLAIMPVVSPGMPVYAY